MPVLINIDLTDIQFTKGGRIYNLTEVLENNGGKELLITAHEVEQQEPSEIIENPEFNQPISEV
jgi:hypothetical protein